MEKNKLFMILLGCKPKGRLTEQHDIFFGIATSIKELVPEMNRFWPEANGELHIDAWREVTVADGHSVEVVPSSTVTEANKKLFFINLGGYKKDEFDEFHYKIVAVGQNLSEATKKAKQTTFYKHCTVQGATSHIDDKYGIDVDDQYNVEDLLTPEIKQKFRLRIVPAAGLPDDEIHIGYLQFKKLLNQ